jgi:hypothetical protein
MIELKYFDYESDEIKLFDLTYMNNGLEQLDKLNSTFELVDGLSNAISGILTHYSMMLLMCSRHYVNEELGLVGKINSIESAYAHLTCTDPKFNFACSINRACLNAITLGYAAYDAFILNKTQMLKNSIIQTPSEQDKAVTNCGLNKYFNGNAYIYAMKEMRHAAIHRGRELAVNQNILPLEMRELCFNKNDQKFFPHIRVVRRGLEEVIRLSLIVASI